MATDNDPRHPKAPVRSTTLLDPRRFSEVSQAFLVEHRKRLATALVQVYQIDRKLPNAWEAHPVALEWVISLALEEPSRAAYAVPLGWGDELLLDQNESPVPPEDPFYVRWNELMAMSLADRVQELESGRKSFEAKAMSTDWGGQARAIGEVTELTFLVNRASLSVNRTALTDDDQSLVQQTLAVVGAVIDLIAESSEAKTLFQTLENLSNGQVLNHMVRVFYTMVSFLLYYNTVHSQGLNRKVRALFPGRFQNQYASLLPHLRESLNTFDNLVRLSQISRGKLNVYALGTLMHDIGKILDLQYFENGAAYDRARILQHPIIGSGLFQKTYGEKHEDARYIVGDHHNYLFHPEGYGLTRWDRLRSARPKVEVVCCISDTLETFRSGQALGFFPVEVCAIIDVYDALTDSSRAYKSGMTPADAVRFMDEHFCRTRKMDPILFGLFVEFLRSMGTDVGPEGGLFG